MRTTKCHTTAVLSRRFSRRALPVCFTAILLIVPRLHGQGYKIFDGKPKRITVSHQWSWRLGNFFDGDYLKRYGFDYLSVSRKEYNDMPIDDTLQVKKGSWLQSFPAAGEPVPDIMVLLVASTAVEGPGDTEHIQLGVRKIQKLVEILKQKGVKEVFVSSRHRRYGRAHSGYTGAVNDEILDTLYLAAYNRLLGRQMAINVMGPSHSAKWAHCHYDWEHPTNYGGTLYAGSWLKAMLRYDGGYADKIAQIDKDLENAHRNAINEKEQYLLTIQTPAAVPKALRVGEKVTLNVHLKSELLLGKPLKLRLTTFIRGTARMYFLYDSLTFRATDNTVSFAIPDSALISPYSGPIKGKIAVEGDSATFQIAEHNSSIYEPTWSVTPTFLILGRDGNPSTGIVHGILTEHTKHRGINSGSSDLLGRRLPLNKRTRPLPAACFGTHR